ncbi:PhoPQ-activated pathogenicity-related family protein [Nitrospira sp. Nam74]
MPKTLYRSFFLVVLATLVFIEAPRGHAANALETYIQQPDNTFAWEVQSETTISHFAVTHVKMTSQTWRDHRWTHDLKIIRPERVRHPEIALLFITGDSSGISTELMLQALADRAGAVVVEVTRVPNQPLLEGRKEDALIAYTFDQYLRTGDETWPALFPMTKSAVRAMDTVQAWANVKQLQKIEKFVVAGASKRGWTTWLTGAIDSRVVAIAPIVIDVLNMKAQTEWAQKVYGRQSDKVSDYTDLNLVQQMDTPPMQKLRSWVDPYTYRARYTMPKLLLLGTNDPYWTVDSLRHYWDDLPDPKFVFQTPNGGHRLSKEASDTLVAFFQMIADQEELPRMEWQLTDGNVGMLSVQVNRQANAIHLWTADSAIRDFRKAEWSSQPLEIDRGSGETRVVVDKPATGYRAFMGEVVFTASTGHDYKLSTQVQVLPDDVK